MKKPYLIVRYGLIIPLVFLTAFCCCAVGKAHAAAAGTFYQQSIAGDQDRSCCQSNKGPDTKKCSCQNIFGTTEKGALQKWVVSSRTDWSPQIHFVSGTSGRAIAFNPPQGLSFYLSQPKYGQSNPPIYLLNRVLRL